MGPAMSPKIDATLRLPALDDRYESLKSLLTGASLLLILASPASVQADAETGISSRDLADARPRARELGIAPGILSTGRLNAITDVEGVRIGHVTLKRGESVRTGATAILPHGGNLYAEKVPAGFFRGNGFGKFAGSTQIDELGEIETPVLLTNTLSVAEGMEAIITWTLRQAGNEAVRSVNAVVGETNDGRLNDIRGRHITAGHMLRAIENARPGPVEEGSVGAGTGTMAFGWKGGIGTSSRRLPESLGGYTVGALVQSNYGGVLAIDGVPVGKELGRYFLEDTIDNASADGSIVVVIATDAPLSDRNLRRMASRSLLAIGRTGSPMTNGSGDYAIAFSTAGSVRRVQGRAPHGELENASMSPLFQATVEATEEAIYNSLFKATTVSGQNRTAEALPVDAVLDIMQRHGRDARRQP